MENKKLNIEDATKCFECGSSQKKSGNSLHCWDIEYDCGCVIWGVISNKDIYLNKKCKNENRV